VGLALNVAGLDGACLTVRLHDSGVAFDSNRC
jgi:hypothetical protein